MLSFDPQPQRIIAHGIDLGTTHSTLCRVSLEPGAYRPAEPQPVTLPQPAPAGTRYSDFLPSMVALHEGREYVGQGAKDLRALGHGLVRNRSLFYECKNEIGTSRTYPNAPPGYRNPTDIAGRVLAYIAREGLTGEEPSQIVVTVPASFQTAQRAATLAACRQAGLDCEHGRLLDEPIAAFIDYAHRYAPDLLDALTEPRKLLIFDFGGGTCDIALFELERPGPGAPVRAIGRAVSRYHRLGGGDIDLAIVHRVLLPQICRQNGLDDFALSYRDKTLALTPALIAIAEGLKIQMSNTLWQYRQFGKTDEDCAELVARNPVRVTLDPTELGRPVTLDQPSLTALEFADILAPFLDTELLYARNTEYRLECSVFAPLEDALERAGWEAGMLTEVLLVGGSSLIPAVGDALRRWFPRARLLEYGDRKDAQLAIARGAALQSLALAVTGRSLVEVVAQDDISIATNQGEQALVRRGAVLPCEGVFELAVPETAWSEPLDLRLELRAGREKRLLFTGNWMLTPPVRQGQPLRLCYRYDENQVFDFRLQLAEFPESPSYEGRVENPLSHVVNPNAAQERIDELEEICRGDPARVDTLMSEVVDLCGELKQYDKAIAHLRALMRRANRPDPYLLNRQAMLEEARGNTPGAVRNYQEAARFSGGWGGPLFNLALLLHRRRDYEAALSALERAMQREERAPYRTLALRIRRAQTGADVAEDARALLYDFDPLDALSDWELGWYRAAASLAGDAEAQRRAREEQERRGIRGKNPEAPTDPGGILPDGVATTAGGR